MYLGNGKIDFTEFVTTMAKKMAHTDTDEVMEESFKYHHLSMQSAILPQTHPRA